MLVYIIKWHNESVFMTFYNVYGKSHLNPFINILLYKRVPYFILCSVVVMYFDLQVSGVP